MEREFINSPFSSKKQDFFVMSKNVTRSFLSYTLITLIQIYRMAVSPFLPPACRYYPSCSTYALLAIKKFGPVKGAWIGLKRIMRCHPWKPGGYDPVP